MATAACAPPLQVISMGGQSVDVDSEGADTVAELRSRLASKLGAAVYSVKLLSGGSLLEDTASPAGLVTVLVSSPGPAWYPASKYLYDGKEVLKVTWGVDHNRGHERHQCKVFWTNGTFWERDDRGQAWTRGEQDWEVMARLEAITLFAKKLAKDLGFVTHTVREYSDFPHFEENFEAVPPEDPDEWEPWSDDYGTHGERRKPKHAPPGSAVEGTAQQADGMPAGAFGMGSKDSERPTDIPNGERIQCLAEDGPRLAEALEGKVGFAKQLNVAELCRAPKVVAAQADGHPSVAFYLDQPKTEPDADIPNGTELPLLGNAGDHAVVHYRDLLGFVELRNLAGVPQS